MEKTDKRNEFRLPHQDGHCQQHHLLRTLDHLHRQQEAQAGDAGICNLLQFVSKLLTVDLLTTLWLGKLLSLKLQCLLWPSLQHQDRRNYGSSSSHWKRFGKSKISYKIVNLFQGLWNEKMRFNSLPLNKDSFVMYVGANTDGRDGKTIMDMFNWLVFILIH